MGTNTDKKLDLVATNSSQAQLEFAEKTLRKSFMVFFISGGLLAIMEIVWALYGEEAEATYLINIGIPIFFSFIFSAVFSLVFYIYWEVLKRKG